jgi:hypothetical protein
MNRAFKKYYFIKLFFTVLSFILLADSKQFAQEKYKQRNDKNQMNEQQIFQSNDQIASTFSSNENRIIHLYAKDFHFDAHMDFPSSVRTKPDKYAESISHENNGALDVILINQGNTIRYLFQVSSIPKQECESDTTRACQQGATDQLARGNIAEIQIVLPGSKLMPGTYTFGKDGSTPREEVMIYSRQLYSDPSHGKLGCKAWGGGAFNVKRADYNANGKLEYFEANLSRVCTQTAPFPPTRPEDNLPQVEVENIETYTYRASWRCHLKVGGEGSR